MRRLKMLIAAIVLVVVLTGVEIYVIRGASEYEAEVEVVFARVKIPEKALITNEMLETKKVGASMAHKFSVKEPGKIVGKNAAMDIESGEMLLSVKVGRLDEMEKITVKDKNKRLFTVEFKGDQANGWWLMADQYVDILFIPDETHEKTEIGVKKLERIRVAALIDERGKLLKNNDRVTLPRYISFEVNDEQVDFLAAAKSKGRIEISVIPEE